tara:strand:+ start:148 stop:1098 length:951 start_codon:yes stop_codon:yes gene_type:complete
MYESQFEAVVLACLENGTLTEAVYDVVTDHLAALPAESDRLRAMRALVAKFGRMLRPQTSGAGSLHAVALSALAEAWRKLQSIGEVRQVSVEMIQLFVRGFTGKTSTINISRDATLFELKCRIQDELGGLRPCEQRLSTGTTQLGDGDDGMCLWYFSSVQYSHGAVLLSESTMQLNGRMCGEVYVFWGKYEGMRHGFSDRKMLLEREKIALASGVPVGRQHLRIAPRGTIVSPLAPVRDMFDAAGYGKNALHLLLSLHDTMDRFRSHARLVGKLGAWRTRAACRVYAPNSLGYAQAATSFSSQLASMHISEGGNCG